jgi:hypothetical protein
MSYLTVAEMVKNQSLTEREYAALAKEGIDPPEPWQYLYRWQLASQPGWDAAWDSAIAGGIEDPGADQGVITDGMILSAIQQIIAAQTPVPPLPGPEPAPPDEIDNTLPGTSEPRGTDS